MPAAYGDAAPAFEHDRLPKAEYNYTEYRFPFLLLLFYSFILRNLGKKSMSRIMNSVDYCLTGKTCAGP